MKLHLQQLDSHKLTNTSISRTSKAQAEAGFPDLATTESEIFAQQENQSRVINYLQLDSVFPSLLM